MRPHAPTLVRFLGHIGSSADTFPPRARPGALGDDDKLRLDINFMSTKCRVNDDNLPLCARPAALRVMPAGPVSVQIRGLRPRCTDLVLSAGTTSVAGGWTVARELDLHEISPALSTPRRCGEVARKQSLEARIRPRSVCPARVLVARNPSVVFRNWPDLHGIVKAGFLSETRARSTDFHPAAAGRRLLPSSSLLWRSQRP